MRYYVLRIYPDTFSVKYPYTKTSGAPNLADKPLLHVKRVSSKLSENAPPCMHLGYARG